MEQKIVKHRIHTKLSKPKANAKKTETTRGAEIKNTVEAKSLLNENLAIHAPSNQSK